MHKNNISQAILHITYACTHHCPMCYANAGENLVQPPVTQLFHVADRLADLGIKDITLVGGDPASYKDILELVRYLKKYDMKISVLSNTLDFIPENQAVLNYIDTFEATIHHSIKEKHDSFCKCPGAYEKIIENLKYFSSQKKRVGLAINLIPFNYDVIYDSIKNVILNGIIIDHVIFQRIIQLGRAAGKNQYELNNTMLKSIMLQIEKAEKDYDLNIIFEDPLPLCSIEAKYGKYMHPCDWGITKVSVDFNGNMSRCGADVFHSFGSIFDESIIEKWNNDSLLNRFRKKDYLPSKCKSCNHLTNCGGGCPISHNPDEGFTLDYLAE